MRKMEGEAEAEEPLKRSQVGGGEGMGLQGIEKEKWSQQGNKQRSALTVGSLSYSFSNGICSGFGNSHTDSTCICCPTRSLPCSHLSSCVSRVT